MNTGTETNGIKGQTRKGAAARALLYLLAVTLVFSAVSILCDIKPVFVTAGEPGVTDLTGFDFNSNIARVAMEHTGSIFIYPGAFYTPEDFAAGRVSNGVLYDRTPGAQGDYGTLRMVLNLPPNETYAIASKSVAYAQRLFIDGRECAPIGVPGDSIDTATPQTKRFVEGFSPTGESTEFIFHYSTLVHADGGGIYPMDVGLVRNIVRNEQLRTFRDTATALAVLTAMLFFFGLFLFFPKGRYLLWFSLACGCVALRGLLAGDKVIASLLPDLDWFLAIRLELLLTCGMALFSSLYLCGLFPGAVNRRIVRGFTVFCAANALFVCLAPPIVFTRYTVFATAAYAVFGLYILASIAVAVIRKKVQSPLSRPEQWLLLTGLFIYAGLSAISVPAHQLSVTLMGIDYPIIGMMIFLFLNILALALGFARTEQMLDETRKAEQEIENTNRTLIRLNRVRSVFLANISHEMKTPLAAINGTAEYARTKLKGGVVWDADLDGSLKTIMERSEDLTVFVTRLLNQAVEQENKLDFAAVPIAKLLDRAAGIMEPLLRERGNRLTLSVDGKLPPLSGVEDMLLRVLLNLISNANRHSEGGEIMIAASLATELMQEGMAEIRVSDRGGGIPEELMPRIFYRGMSGDGSSGLGLTICKDIVETHGGEIFISSEAGTGTEVWFTIPLAKE